MKEQKLEQVAIRFKYITLEGYLWSGTRASLVIDDLFTTDSMREAKKQLSEHVRKHSGDFETVERATAMPQIIYTAWWNTNLRATEDKPMLEVVI